MTGFDEQDYITLYEQARGRLDVHTDDRDAQYHVVLNLARAGSTEAALQAYEEYGLGQSADNEDHMALGARLSKDLYLQSEDAAAQQHLKTAARQYLRAFNQSGGYFSGINAATLAHLADPKSDQTQDLLTRVSATLFHSAETAPEDQYYLLASRAEMNLLEGDIPACRAALKTALSYDPLNYAAHGTTLKQFGMILSARGEPLDWLQDFAPPKAMHFTGHIFAPLSKSDEARFKTHLSDEIQNHDIGFGYGAMAAGSDISISEALIEEGGQLHIILPTDAKTYRKTSVVTFGKSWGARFDRCLEQAASVQTLTHSKHWPDQKLDRAAARIAMGKTRLRAAMLAGEALQLNIISDPRESSWSNAYSEDWTSHEGAQISLPPPSDILRPHQSRKTAELPDFPVSAHLRDAAQIFATAQEAVNWALRRQAQNSEKLALTYDLPDSAAHSDAQAILDAQIPGQIFAHEALACLLAWEAPQDYTITFAGTVTDAVRVYAIKKA